MTPEIINPVQGKSFISIWTVPPSYSNEKGTMSFQGGIPSPGINSSSALALTIAFRAIEPGETSIRFLDTSKVLLDDGRGANVLSSLGSGKYTISLPPPEGPNISSPTHPDQNKWYKSNNIVFSWNRENGVADFSYMLDSEPQEAPDDESEGNKSSVSYSNLEDGIWYFHIKAKKENVWGGVSHYLARIDGSSPASFIIEVSPSVKTSFTQPIISFITTDAFSGLDHYEIKVVDITADHKTREEAFFVEAASPYQLSSLEIGKYLIVTRAFDKAGNWREESKEIEISPERMLVTQRGIWLEGSFLSWWPILLALLILIILIFSALVALYRREKKRETHLANELREKEKIIRNNLEKLKGHGLI